MVVSGGGDGVSRGTQRSRWPRVEKDLALNAGLGKPSRQAFPLETAQGGFQHLVSYPDSIFVHSPPVFIEQRPMISWAP